MKCPNCGGEVRIPSGPSGYWSMVDYERSVRNEKWGGITCDGCPAVLTISYEGSEPLFVAGTFSLLISVAGPAFLHILRAPQVFIVDVFVFFLALAALFFARGYTKRKLVVTEIRPSCPSCGTSMENKDTRFCPRCGSAITAEAPGAPLRVKRAEIPITERIGTCMICNLGLRSNDLLARCPHCGSAAHRKHLLEWVHVKKRCPACNEHIDEREINKQTDEESTLQKRKKPWRTV